MIKTDGNKLPITTRKMNNTDNVETLKKIYKKIYVFLNVLLKITNEIYKCGITAFNFSTRNVY